MTPEANIALLGGTPRFSPNTFPLDRPGLSAEAEVAATRALRSQRWSMFTSDEVAAFESEFAAFIGARHAVLVTSGTAALTAALSACDLSPGSHVAVPCYTHIGTALPVQVLGLRPQFVDLETVSQTMSLSGLRDACRARELGAVISAQLFGMSGSFEGIGAQCASSGIQLIFDCAQLLGNRAVTSRMTELGTCCFSLGESKVLRVGEGGVVATNSENVADRARSFRHAGEVWLKHGLSRSSLPDPSPWDVLYGLGSVRNGSNLRPLAVAAALARQKLVELPDQLRRLEANANVMSAALARSESVLAPSSVAAWWSFPVVVCDQGLPRNVLLAALLAEGVPAGVHFPRLLPEQPVFADEESSRGEFPNGKRFAEQHLVLPIYPALETHEVAAVATAVRELSNDSRLRTRSASEAAEAYLRGTTVSELVSGLYMKIIRGSESDAAGDPARSKDET